MIEEKSKQDQVIILWGPKLIGWLTLLVSLIFGATLGIAAGSVLATIEWYRIGIRGKAIIHLLLGIVLAIFVSVGLYFFDYHFPTSYIWRLAIISFLIVAPAVYLYKVISRDFVRLQIEYEVKLASYLSAVGISIVVLVVMFVMEGIVNYQIAVAQTPKVRSTATLIPEAQVKIVGKIHPWTDAPIAERQLVLCELIDTTPLIPYDCRLTDLVATTDGEGTFRFEQVPSGMYLVFYDSGTSGTRSFEWGVARWSGKDIQLGDFARLSDQGFFEDNPDDTFSFFIPKGENREFYLDRHIELTLMASGSPFFVAHDIEAAMLGEYEKFEHPFKPHVLPPSGIFVPIAVEVVEGYTSQVEFDVVYW